MKILKSILTGAFWLLIVSLLLAPLAIIWQISQREMEEYATPEVPILRETAVGELAQARRQDVQEYVILSGTFTGVETAYQELNSRQAGSIRWLVDIGDEIQQGQVLGTYKGKEILSEVTGILEEMDTYSTAPYLRFRLFSPVVLECDVQDKELSMLSRETELSTEAGEPVRLVYASRQKNPDGTTRIRLSIESDRFTYGQSLKELRIMTGMVYRKTLVLPADCVYQKRQGENEPWYVRQVTEEGIYIGELPVQISYSNGELICISGVEEGAWFDSGYKAIIGD